MKRRLRKRYGHALGDHHFTVMLDKDGHWVWQGGVYRPLILMPGKRSKATVRRALRAIAGNDNFTFAVATAKQLGRE